MFHEPPSAAERTDAHVHVHTLGRFSVEVDGRPLRFGQKAQKKPMALLKVLVALGGDNVHVEQLTDSLWPESDGDQAYSAFSSTLARLRKLIGRDALLLADGRLTLAPAACWVDAHAFAQWLEDAARAADAGDAEAAWHCAEQALALYRGPFVEGEFEPPELLTARDRLHGLFLRRVEQLVAFFAGDRQPQRAIQLCQRGLEIDPVAEALHRDLMRCLHRSGRQAEALAAYQRCRELLRSSVGAEPSPETERLHQELLSQPPPAMRAAPAAAAHAPPAPVAQAPAHPARAPAPRPPEQPSIAVLPFDTLSDDPEQVYFADGLVEDIITELCKSHWLQVIARNTSFTFRERGSDPRQVAEELGVRYVLAGSVRRLGRRARITARLLEAPAGAEIWAERYDVEEAELFDVQDDIVARVAGAAGPELYAAEVRRAQRRPAEPLEVWNLAVRGRWHVTRLTRADYAEAQRLLEQALALDPDHALALAFLAYCHVAGVLFGWSVSPPQSIAEARRLAERALSLDENDAWVQCVMGLTSFISRQPDQAIAFYQRALDLNPNFALAHGYHGLALAYAGEPERAIQAVQRALRLSPRDPELIHFHVAAGTAHFVAGAYEAAVQEARHAIRVRPEVPAGLRLLAASLARLGRLDEAREAVSEVLRQRPSMTAAAVRATIHFKHPAHQERFIEALLQAGLPPGEPAEPGERRPATVVAFRLAGPEQAGVAPDPEEVDERMSILRRAAEPHVAAHGGVLHPYTGDALAACFGLSGAHEDDPVRAVRAAMAVCAAWDALAAQDNAGGLVPPALHIGIESGPVVVRPAAQGTGRPEAVGELLAVARRLAEQASPGEIVVGADALRHVQGFFAMEPIAAGAGPWRVAGDRAIETRFDAAERRGLTPLVGREPELALLHASLERALAGQGQLVTVSGEAGVGKSRLLYEFRQGLDRERVAVLQGRCQSYGATIPYFPLLDALRRGLRLHEESDPAKLHETAVASIRAIDPALEPHIPLYLHLLSIPSADFPVPKRLQGPELQGAIHEAWAELTLASAQQRPLVWMLEDWHWADEASDAALQYLVGRMGPQPLLLLAAHRPDYQPRWGHPGHHTPIVLQALDARYGEALIKATWRAERLPEGLAALLLERTGGNPFFIEEACRTLAEEGAVRVEAGQAELTRPLARVALPETVQAVIRARLDRLDPEARQMLRLAAVIGREFDQRLLERIVPGPQHLPAMLETLRALELIQQARVLPERAWRFKHALTQEVAYDSLLRAQRREVHAEVARAIEELHGERLEEQVEVLARHYSLAEEWELAVRYGRQAAEKAQKLSQAHQAVHLYEQAVNLLQYLPESPERKRLLGDLLLDTVWSFLTIGQFDRVLEASGRVESIARDLDDRVRLGKALIGYGMAHVYKGDAEATERRLLQSIETLDGTGEDAAVSWAKHVLGASYLGQGLWPRVEPLLAPSLETYQRLNLRQDYFYGSFVLPYVAASGQLSYALSVQGRIEEARQLITAAGAPELDGVSNLTSKVTLMLWHALHVALTGEDRLNAASRAAEHARIAENAELPFLQLGAYVSRTNVELAAEDFNALRADGVKALQIVAARSLRTGHVANLRYNLALAEVALGDREAAGRHYEAGRELVELSPHWWGPRYEFLQGLLLATGDAPDVNAAQAAFERSIAGDEEVGAVVPAAQTRYHLALLLGRHGGHERVRAMLDELARQFAAWGIPVWEARCRQALSRLPAS